MQATLFRALLIVAGVQAFFAALRCAEAAASAATKPNIVFFLADDIGINGVGCYGSDRFRGKTPHLDALAKSGVRFDYGFSMPTCNPSRCAAMTGRYGFRTGNNPSFKEEPSIARVLKQSGYVTGMAGKWRQMEDTPQDWGFDEYLTDPEASGYFWERTYTKNGETVTTDAPVYYPDVCLDFARDFFARHREQPFFFYYPTHLIHNPIVRTPDSKAGVTDPDALYEDNVAYLDKELGKLVAALDSLGLRERTLIVFAGDNGTAKYGQEKGTIGGRQLSGLKASMLEGGSRVPLIASYPGTAAAGKVSHDLVDFTDFLPTFAEIAGAATPTGITFDGHSFAPQLRGEQGSPREWVYVQHNTAHEWYVREHGWKLTHRGELFDMSDAPFVEKLVSPDAATESASAARKRLQAALDALNPAAGKLVPADRKKPAKKKKKVVRNVGLEASGEANPRANERPNVVLVLADDLGWADVAFHGGNAPTPHLDRLAREGVEFTQHYVHPVCSPTRTALMTGRYGSRFGVTSPQAERALPWDTVTLPRALKSVGYDTCIAGKWHLGSKPDWGPKKFGFDHSYGSLGGGVGPWNHRYKEGPYTMTWHRDDVLLTETGHVTDLIANEAVQWLESRGATPFFLYVPFTALHLPIKEPDEYLNRVPTTIKGDVPRHYAACIMHLDAAIGRILATLEKRGLRDNTVVIFSSDNGGSTSENSDTKYPADDYPEGALTGNNRPLRGQKGQLYEGGIRVPTVASWPKRFAPRKVESPVCIADWMPTLAALAGYQTMDDLRWDGRDIGPLLQGSTPAEPPTLYGAAAGFRASYVRDGDWKLIVTRNGKQPDELFDLSRDPYEQENVAAREPQRVAELKAILQRLAAADNDRAVPKTSAGE